MESIKGIIEGYKEYYQNESMESQCNGLERVITALAEITGDDKREIAGKFIGSFAHHYDSKVIHELVVRFRLKVKAGYKFVPE